MMMLCGYGGVGVWLLGAHKQATGMTSEAPGGPEQTASLTPETLERINLIIRRIRK